MLVVIDHVVRTEENAGDFDLLSPGSAARPGRRLLFDVGDQGWQADGIRQRRSPAPPTCSPRTSRWEYDDLPDRGGEVDCRINASTLANDMCLGADVSAIAKWFLDHRTADGGWNCAWVDGSTRSWFHSTLSAVKGLLYHEAMTGGNHALRAPAVQARSACWSVGCCARCRRAGNRDDVSAVVASAA
jgi:hypothetical protein